MPGSPPFSRESSPFGDARRFAGLLFLLLLVFIYVTALAIRGVLGEVPRGDWVAGALTVDLVLLVPLLYHLLLVRPRGWPPLSTLPVILLSLGGAALVLPEGFRGGVEVLGALALPVELFLIGYIGYRTWKAVSAFRCRSLTEEGGEAPDLLAQLRDAALEAVRVPRAAEVLAYELAIFYYALFSWRFKLATDRGGGAENLFSYHRVGNYAVVLIGLLFAVVAELAVVHVVLVQVGMPLAAWTLTALSLYGFLWLLGDYRAMVLRPVRIGPQGIEVRIGLRWTVHVPFERIDAVRRVDWRSPDAAPGGKLRAAVLAAPQYRIELSRTMEARGLYGLRKKIGTVDLAVDNPARFAAILEEYAAPRCLLREEA